ncbi:MarR family winged helix-turn-helix transcriptional regulator [Gorillibacterium massiliense]|uniref:MarR family winged helix-turn-helix transcriptional regulator n=1 Tax=Gorillibacterium massiliense TaxID=1280390 RepID=UPI0004BABB64|nr:MarR family transcriptional regulator [Gorillibacterium massiliense]
MADSDLIARVEVAFAKIFKNFSAVWSRVIDKKVTQHQIMVLSRLHALGPLNVSAIAEALNITAGAVTGISDKLIESGYAERIRDDEDRRVVRLSITPLGVETLQDVRKKKDQVVRQVLQGVNEEDLEHVMCILEKFQKNMERL